MRLLNSKVALQLLQNKKSAHLNGSRYVNTAGLAASSNRKLTRLDQVYDLKTQMLLQKAEAVRLLQSTYNLFLVEKKKFVLSRSFILDKPLEQMARFQKMQSQIKLPFKYVIRNNYHLYQFIKKEHFNKCNKEYPF